MSFSPQSSQYRGYGDAKHRSIENQGDAGWGVARREPKFSVFRVHFVDGRKHYDIQLASKR